MSYQFDYKVFNNNHNNNDDIQNDLVINESNLVNCFRC